MTIHCHYSGHHCEGLVQRNPVHGAYYCVGHWPDPVDEIDLLVLALRMLASPRTLTSTVRRDEIASCVLRAGLRCLPDLAECAGWWPPTDRCPDEDDESYAEWLIGLRPGGAA